MPEVYAIVERMVTYKDGSTKVRKPSFTEVSAGLASADKVSVVNLSSRKLEECWAYWSYRYTIFSGQIGIWKIYELAMKNRKPAHNRTYKKLAVQCFVLQLCGGTNIRSSYEHLW